MVVVQVQPSKSAARPDALRGVRAWLLLLIFLVFAMVLVGGATRLTESGLSITEWNLVTGTLPPLGGEAWKTTFELYRQSPQYGLLNRGMTLLEFKEIFWWEWAHRELGRFIGIVYIAGFALFGIRRAVPRRTLVALAAMGALLAAQGAVGWIMVASGLQPGMTAVAPVKLALHLILACLFFAALVLMFVRLGGAERERACSSMRSAAWVLVLLAFVQIALGGLMAGYDAGLVYNNWPLMDGRLVPSGLFLIEPAWRNLIDNATTIQFNHRVGGYVLTASIFVYLLAVWGRGRALRERALVAAACALSQVAIGVATLIHGVPVHLALMHQGMALVLLLVLVWNAAVLIRGD
jgi:heme a synthase